VHTVNELKAAGAKITEQEKLRYMLKALPHSYSYIGDLMDVLKEEERNVDYLKSKIKLKSLEEKNPNEKTNEENNIKSNAFTTDTRKCHRCGKPGHLQKDCYQQNCYRCGKPGHLQKDCYQQNFTISEDAAGIIEVGPVVEVFINEATTEEITEALRIHHRVIMDIKVSRPTAEIRLLWR